MQNLQELLKVLIHSPLDFVLIGGFAAVLHGCNQTTRDIDICVVMSPDEIIELRNTLRPFHPRHRMTTKTLSFLDHPQDLHTLKNLYLDTDLGVLDIVSHVEAVGGFLDLLPRTQEISLFNETCYLIGLDDLIASKTALGRHRDLVVVEELRAIRYTQTHAD